MDNHGESGVIQIWMNRKRYLAERLVSSGNNTLTLSLAAFTPAGTEGIVLGAADSWSRMSGRLAQQREMAFMSWADWGATMRLNAHF